MEKEHPVPVEKKQQDDMNETNEEFKTTQATQFNQTTNSTRLNNDSMITN